MKIFGICGFLAGSVAMHDAHAVWDVVPEVRMLMEANDNPRLNAPSQTRTDVQDATRTMVDGRVDLSNIGQRGELFVQPRARIDAYGETENKDLESEDLFLNFRGEYRWTSTSLGVSGNVSSQSVLSSELEDAIPLDPDFEDPIDTSSGTLDVISEDRFRSIIAPYVEFGISPRNSFRFEGRYIDQSYSGAGSQVSERSDFQDTLVAAGIVRNLDERNVVTARLRTSQFEADKNQNVTDTVAVEGTFSRPISETWELNLGVGVQRSDYAFIDEDGELIDNADTNYALDLGFRHRTERNTFNYNVRRTMNPNSLGFLVEQNEFSFFMSRLLTPRVTGSFALRALERRTLDNINQDNDRNYMRTQLGVEWAITQHWNVTGAFIYTFQEFATDDADSNAFNIGVTYRGLSRLTN